MPIEVICHALPQASSSKSQRMRVQCRPSTTSARISPSMGLPVIAPQNRSVVPNRSRGGGWGMLMDYLGGEIETANGR